MPSDTKAWDAIMKSIEQLGAGEVKVGLLEDTAHKQAEGSDLSLLEIGIINELGSADGHVPERSFIRSTFTIHRASDLASLQHKLARAVVERGMPPQQALGIMGETAAGWIKETIRERKTVGPRPQENAPSTIARKGSDLPLVDSSQLINGISWAIE